MVFLNDFIVQVIFECVVVFKVFSFLVVTLGFVTVLFFSSASCTRYFPEEPDFSYKMHKNFTNM